MVPSPSSSPREALPELAGASSSSAASELAWDEEDEPAGRLPELLELPEPAELLPLDAGRLLELPELPELLEPLPPDEEGRLLELPELLPDELDELDEPDEALPLEELPDELPEELLDEAEASSEGSSSPLDAAPEEALPEELPDEDAAPLLDEPDELDELPLPMPLSKETVSVLLTTWLPL